MRSFLDLLPFGLWALTVAAHVYAAITQGPARARKEPLMSEASTNDQPITTAPVDPTPAIAAFVQHPVTQAVIQGVQANPAVPASNWASVAASVLNSLMPVVQPAMEISRASSKTQGEIAIGLAAIEAILSVFAPHPSAA